MTSNPSVGRSTGDLAANDLKTNPIGPYTYSKLWILLSFVLSILILGWGLSLPFRQHDRPLLLWDESDVPRSDSDDVRKVRLSREEAEAYRAAAIEHDQQFLRARRDQLRQRINSNPVGAEHAMRAEQARIASQKKTIEQLRDAPDDSLAGQYRRELEAALNAGTDESKTEPQ